MRKAFLVILMSYILLLTGCNTNSSEPDKLMDVSMNTIDSIVLYSDGKSTELSSSSDEFLSLATIINENEDNVGIIDGGLGADMAGADVSEYSEYSAKENCKIYIITFTQAQQISYGEYNSSNANITGIFIVPEKQYFGTIIKDTESGNISYATFMNAENDIF